MKRFVIFTLIFVMLGCAIIVLWADVRTRNVNQREFDKSDFWTRCG